ncbi:MAG: limonene-1,2-epoxide hydrolase family protein [Pseudomonadota bacterium]
MTSAPLTIALAFLRAMEAKDYAAAKPFLADDISYTNGPMTTVSGPEAVLAILEPFFAPIEENDFVIEASAVNEDRVFLQRLDRHRVSAGWFELPVTGVFVIRDGRISVWQEYFDLATIQNAMTRLLDG